MVNRRLLAVVGPLVVVTQAGFVGSPIYSKNGVMMQSYAESLQGFTSSSQLLIKIPPSKMSCDNVPCFNIMSDRTIKWEDRNRCLEAVGHNKGAAVRLNDCTGEAAQTWIFLPDRHGGGLIQLQDTNLCLETELESVQLQECQQTGGETWKFEMPSFSSNENSSHLRYFAISLIALVGFGAVSLSTLLWRQSTNARAFIKKHGGARIEEGGISLSAPSSTNGTSLKFEKEALNLNRVTDVLASGNPWQAGVQADSEAGGDSPTSVEGFSPVLQKLNASSKEKPEAIVLLPVDAGMKLNLEAFEASLSKANRAAAGAGSPAQSKSRGSKISMSAAADDVVPDMQRRTIMNLVLWGGVAPLASAASLRPVQPASADEPPVTASVFSKTFTSGAIGLDLNETSDGLTQVTRVIERGAAWAQGVRPFVIVVGVNGKSVSGMRVAEVQALIKQAPRPVTIDFEALLPDQAVKNAAEARGAETATFRIDKTPANQGLTCGMKTTEGDFIEFEYTAALEETGDVFDSSARRSGRPFAVKLGNGDVVKGLELGLLEMCIGEERTLRVPPELGYGKRGNKLYGVPPNAALVYQVKLVSINMVNNSEITREEL